MPYQQYAFALYLELRGNVAIKLHAVQRPEKERGKPTPKPNVQIPAGNRLLYRRAMPSGELPSYYEEAFIEGWNACNARKKRKAQ